MGSRQTVALERDSRSRSDKLDKVRSNSGGRGPPGSVSHLLHAPKSEPTVPARLTDGQLGAFRERMKGRQTKTVKQ